MIAGALCLAGPLASYAQVGLAMTPMRVDLDGGPGSSHVGGIQIANETDSPVRMRAEILDFSLDETGTPQFLKEIVGESASSCRQWLTVNPMETEISGGEKVLARFALRIPKEAQAREYHCAVGFTTLPTANEAPGLGMRMAVRMVSSFYVKPRGLRGEPEFADLLVERVPGGAADQWQVVPLFRNKGLAHFRAKGDVALLDASGTELEKVPVPSMPVLPEREQRFPIALKTGLAGKRVKLVARVDLGSGEVQEATLTFDGPPAAPPSPIAQR